MCIDVYDVHHELNIFVPPWLPKLARNFQDKCCSAGRPLRSCHHTWDCIGFFQGIVPVASVSTLEYIIYLFTVSTWQPGSTNAELTLQPSLSTLLYPRVPVRVPDAYFVVCLPHIFSVLLLCLKLVRFLLGTPVLSRIELLVNRRNCFTNTYTVYV